MTDEQKKWMLEGGRLAYLFLSAWLMTKEEIDTVLKLIETLEESEKGQGK